MEQTGEDLDQSTLKFLKTGLHISDSQSIAHSFPSSSFHSFFFLFSLVALLFSHLSLFFIVDFYFYPEFA